MEQMNSQENNFKKTIVSLKSEIEKLDDAMLSRDNVIGAKEKKIYKLKVLCCSKIQFIF